MTAPTKKINWQVPAAEWDAFVEWVHESKGGENGAAKGELGTWTHMAMREYLDLDGKERVEERYEGLTELAAGYVPETDTATPISTLTQQDTTLVGVRVPGYVKDEFGAYADQHDSNKGVILARALNAYRGGGVMGRLDRLADRLDSDLSQSALAEANDDSDGGLTKRERKIREVASELGEAFRDHELTDAIKPHAGNGPNPSPQTIEGWRQDVIDHIGVEPHPNAETDTWLPPAAAENVAPDGLPRVCRLPVEMLDPSELVGRVQIEAAYYALQHGAGGVEKVPYSVLRERVLDDDFSKEEMRTLMARVTADEEVGFEDGISHGETVLEVDANEAMSAGTIYEDTVRAYIEDEEVVGILRQGPRTDASRTRQPSAADGGDWF